MRKNPLESAQVGQVVAAIDGDLKPRGFRRVGRIFNRTTQDGLVQVVHVWIRRAEFSGGFTVTVGVCVPEVAQALRGRDPKGVLGPYHCTLLVSLGRLGPEKCDLWWRNAAAAEVVPEILQRLKRDALPYLERHASRDAILQEWDGKSETMGFWDPSRIALAVILVRRGEPERARQLLDAHVQDTSDSGHADWVRGFAEWLGIPLPPRGV